VHNFGTCKKNSALQLQLWTKVCVQTRILVGSRHPAAAFFFASTEVVHRPASNFPVYFDIRKIQQIWAIQRPRTRSATARQVSNAHERILVTKKTIQTLHYRFLFMTRSRSWALLTWRAAADLVRGRCIAICMEKSHASARHFLPANMIERWPHTCRVKITFGSLSTIYFVS